MTDHTLTITYSLPIGTADGQDLLRLEQEDWSVYTGAITKGEMIRWLGAMIQDTTYQPLIDCGLAGDQLVCTLYAYPYQPELIYQLHPSWGTLSERRVETIEIREMVQFRLTTEARTDYPVRQILGVDWAADCYGPEGEIVPPPPLTADRETLSCTSPVYGTAAVHYTCERHTYILNAPRRETALDNQWSVIVVGVYEGGLTWVAVEMPPGIERFEADPDAICGRRSGSGSVIMDDELPPVQPNTARRTTEIDYCTQEVLTDRIE